MALYLVVHTPRDVAEEEVRPPTKLRALAVASRRSEGKAHWLRTWSPDLHDNRLFTLWEATSAEEVTAALNEFGFLDNMDAAPLRVREWGPDEVLASG